MRIVHVLPALVKGGGERVVVDLANHQAAAGHEVTVITAVDVDPTLLRDRLSASVAVESLTGRGARMLSAYLRIPGWLRRRRDWLRTQDVMHCHLTFGSMVGAAAMRMRRRGGWPRPVIVETYHAVGMPIPRYHRWLHAQLLSNRDALVLMARDDYWSRFVANRPLQLSRTIHNGVDAAIGRAGDDAELLAYRRSIGIPDDCTLILGTVGQLRDDRQPWIYIPIFKQVADALGDGVHFIIAGGGPALERVQAAISEHGLDGRVHLPGQVASAALPASIMDVYITLAVGPVVGLAALEAAFVPVPVIAIQLRNDYICPASDWVWSSQRPRAVADRAIELLREPAGRAALGEKQHQTVLARHSASAMAEAYRTLYADAIADLEESRVPARHRQQRNKDAT